jgi:hypothetical protein
MNHAQIEVIDSTELAKRLHVPETWVRSRTNLKRTDDPSRVVPNLDHVIQAAQIFDVHLQLSTSPPLDCRKAGAPVDCRVSPPLNSRT